MDPGWVTAAIALATVLVAVLAWMARWAWKLGRKAWQFIADWEGIPAMHGRPARPGVIERLEKLEATTIGISEQVHLNSGHSLKDVVIRTEVAVGELKQSVDALTKQAKGGNP